MRLERKQSRLVLFDFGEKIVRGPGHRCRFAAENVCCFRGIDVDNYLKDYIEQIRQKQKKHIYIFGAGKVGRILHDVCGNTAHIAIDGFLVSLKKGNPAEVRGLPVFAADDSSMDKDDSLVLIGVMERGKEKIADELKALGYKNVIPVPKDIMAYDPWEYRRLSSPIVEVTPKIGCAVNCRYCPQKRLLTRYFADNPRRKSMMNLEDFKTCIDKLPPNTIIDFAGFVEPFLNPAALDMMEYVHKTGHDMTLFTTFVGFKREELPRLLRLPFQEVVWHTADDKNYANIPVTNEYLALTKDVLAAKNPQSGESFITSANCQFTPHEKILEITQGKLKIFCEMTDRAGNLDEEDPNLSHAAKRGAIVCSRTAHLNHNILLPDGSLVLCCNDFGLEHILGNLLKDDYADITAGEEMKNIRENMCQDVDANFLCRKCIYAKTVG